MSKPRIVVLGAGPAGLGAAYRLRHLDRADVTVVEQNAIVGGNAGSFELNDQRLDYGSHRLHPACDPEILEDIRRFLGPDLLERPRHGRILLRGRWIHFPLKPLDLLLRLDPGFAFGTITNMAFKPFRAHKPSEDTFASALLDNLGPTICEDFYFPYARKIWGVQPETLSAIQAKRRVSAGSFSKLLKKVMSQVPGFKKPGAGRFFYPRGGFGQISEAYADTARSAGAEIVLNSRVTKLTPPGPDGGAWGVEVDRDDERVTLEADYLWSTIPINLLVRLIDGQMPAELTEAIDGIEYRAMLLIYLTLDVDRFTQYDAHYFPSSDIRITRLSEPKNYADLAEPRDRTTLCAELPCSSVEERWTMDDTALGRLVTEDLERAGIPLPRKPVAVYVKRLKQAYPIYKNGYEIPFKALDEWVENRPRLLSFGRQGLFAHDNTHHALFMAYSAVDCLENGGFDQKRWADYRRIFETHVVED